MNRRDSLRSLAAGMFGAVGIEASAEVVADDPRPLFVVIRTKRHVSVEAAESMRKAWDRFRELSPDIPPACVIGPEIEIELKRERD